MNKEHVIIKSIDMDFPLLIDRRTLEMSISPATNLPDVNLGDIQGIVGIKHLVKYSYLIGVSSATLIDRKRNICKIDSVSTFPIQEYSSSQYDSERDTLEWQWEKTYLQMISDLFKKCNFYYSNTYDLTNSLQRNYEIRDGSSSKQYSQHPDQRFQWNYNALELFDAYHTEISRFRLPIIMGFVTKTSIDEGRKFEMLLISRRGIRRAGTRYNRRGVDDQGNVANFVETEQILDAPGGESSYVQVRGSIPMFWGQTPTCRYKPAIEIYQGDHDNAMVKHYRDLKASYGAVSVACLIDQRGHEAQLATEFNQRMSKIQALIDVRYHYFDFHKECGKMKWHRLNLLIQKLKPEIDSYGFFALPSSGVSNITKQIGVVRSNCIDSLDRTNVIQSMISEYILDIQLRALNNMSLSQFPAYIKEFKSAWADNADALSTQYAGTPALKTDFTRTGQRTYAGIFRDGFNSATRYILNNYLDNYRQDSMDLLLGNFVGYPSPTYRPLDLASYSSTFPVAVVMFTLVALYVYFRYDSIRFLEN